MCTRGEKMSIRATKLMVQRCEVIRKTTYNIYMKEGYAALNMARIAEESGIYRNALYKLYKGPADILLDILGYWLDEHTKVLLSQEEQTVSPLYKIIGIMDLDINFKRLGAIYPLILEPSATDQSILKFRKKMKRFIEILGIVSMEFDPDLTLEEYTSYYQSFLILALGVTNLYTYDKKIIEVNNKLGIDYIEFGICELVIDFFAGTRGLEEAVPYLEEVIEIVNSRKCSAREKHENKLNPYFGGDYEF